MPGLTAYAGLMVYGEPKDGDIIVVSIKDAIPRAKVKKGEVFKAVIVRTSKEYTRNDGSTIKFGIARIFLDSCTNFISSSEYPLSVKLPARGITFLAIGLG